MILRITKDVYLCQFEFLEKNENYLIDVGITHIISFCKIYNKFINEKFFILNLSNNNNNNNNIYIYLFSTLDFLRHCMLFSGKILFIDDYFYPNLNFKPNFLIRNLLLTILSFYLNQNVYDCYTYLNSKNLFYNIPYTCLPEISLYISNLNQIKIYIENLLSFKCFCGAIWLILKNEFNIKIKKKCNCQRGHSSQQYSECPSNGCNEYINKIKKYYGIYYDSLYWIYAENKDFLFDFKSFESKMICNSRGINENLEIQSVNDKYSMKASGRKNTWTVFKCKICNCVMFGESNGIYQILKNNEYKKKDNFKIKNELKDINLNELLS